jgi:chemotaxis protein methyltransferase CheR
MSSSFPASPPVTPPPWEPVSLTDREFALLRALVREHTGIALRDSKRALVCARLGRRLRHHGYTSFTEYCTHLAERDADGEERRCLINAITTTKTDFFRERHHFDFLQTVVVPAFIGDDNGPIRMRLWSAGCSTGEEPYTLAITLLESLPRGRSRDVRILASDINTDVLAVAAAGVYGRDVLGDVPRALQQRYFEAVAGDPSRLTVGPAARALITLRQINLCRRPWPIRTQFDVIFCRNVLIYFDPATQSRLLDGLLAALAPGGYVFLGHSESLLGAEKGLRYVTRTVYQKPLTEAS